MKTANLLKDLTIYAAITGICFLVAPYTWILGIGAALGISAIARFFMKGDQ